MWRLGEFEKLWGWGGAKKEEALSRVPSEEQAHKESSHARTK